MGDGTILGIKFSTIVESLDELELLGLQFMTKWAQENKAEAKGSMPQLEAALYLKRVLEKVSKLPKAQS